MAAFVNAIRLIALAALGLSLAGCAQPRDRADVGIGTAAYVHKQAEPYAHLYLPYAQMAALAYADPQFLNGRWCPSRREFENKKNVDAKHPQSENDDMAAWLKAVTKEWRCEKGFVGTFGCPKDQPCVNGLEYHVWRRKGDCSTAVIAFRGTDFDETGPFLSRGDLVSNLRWIINLPVFDEYEQVQLAARFEAGRIWPTLCGSRRIIATGHSLGGGLAQQAAYADHRINYVYGFDPSPVTGLFDIPWSARQRSTENLGIDRIYQSGEILSLPRYLASGAFATSPCQPRIRIVRFATLTVPGLVERHRIRNMTDGLTELSKSPPPKPKKLPTGFANARNCDFTGNDPEMTSNYQPRMN